MLVAGDQALDACQEIAQDTLVEGMTAELNPDYEARLFHDFALTTEDAHTGTQILTQLSSEDVGDEDWTDWDDSEQGVATAALEDITNNPLAVGDTTITVALTAGFTTDGIWLFLEDITDFEDSEWVFQQDHTVDTSIEVLDEVTRAHLIASTLYNTATRRSIRLPYGARRVRVIYNNRVDPDGSTVAVRSRLLRNYPGYKR